MKTSTRLIKLALLSAFLVPALVSAQTPPSNNSTLPPPPPPVNPLPSGDAHPPATLGARIQSQYQTDMHNLENNRDYRNTLMHATGTPMNASSTPPGTGRFGSTTPMRFASTSMPRHDDGPDGRPNFASTTMPRMMQLPPRLVPPLMRRFASSTELGSTTLIQKITEDHQRELKVRADAFAYLQNNLVAQLNQALSNLQQIRGRIADRIQTETGKGIDMGKAKALLATADSDITTTTAAIQALAAYAPPSGSTIAASSTVDLAPGRQLGKVAIDSVGTVRKALGDTVKAIADAMGVQPAGTSTDMLPPPKNN